MKHYYEVQVGKRSNGNVRWSTATKEGQGLTKLTSKPLAQHLADEFRSQGCDHVQVCRWDRTVIA